MSSTTAQTELIEAASAGARSLRVASVDGFHVGGMVRLHDAFSNQEDHQVRWMTARSLWLSGKVGLEFNHNQGEAVTQLDVVPECLRNCSSRAPCVDGVCDCPPGFGGDDCSVTEYRFGAYSIANRPYGYDIVVSAYAPTGGAAAACDAI